MFCSETVHRDYLGQRLDIEYVYLKLNQAEGEARLERRKDHFMPIELIKSQLDTLEEPIDVLTLTTDLSLPRMIKEAELHFADFL